MLLCFVLQGERMGGLLLLFVFMHNSYSDDGFSIEVSKFLAIHPIHVLGRIQNHYKIKNEIVDIE